MSKKMKIKRGDTVQVITGSREDKGKRGEVIKVMSTESRIVVQGVRLAVLAVERQTNAALSRR